MELFVDLHESNFSRFSSGMLNCKGMCGEEVVFVKGRTNRRQYQGQEEFILKLYKRYMLICRSPCLLLTLIGHVLRARHCGRCWEYRDMVPFL